MYSVLTYIFNNGDTLREIPQEDGVEYVCVTDNPTLQQEGWKIIVDKDLDNLDPVYASFYVRYHPFKYCSGDICMRIDGSVKIEKPLFPFFKEFEESGKDVLVMTNARATTLDQEYSCWLWPSVRKMIKQQKEYLQSMGVNTNKEGCIQSPISITKNTDICNKCDALCWELIDKFSTETQAARPSQAIMTIALHLTDGINIMFVDENLFSSDTFSWHNHNSNVTRKTFLQRKHTSFFGNPIKIYKFNAIHYKPSFLFPKTCKRSTTDIIVNIRKLFPSKQDMFNNS